ncbi:MAG TPA: NRDE family protein [Burkholderiales bacterium]|nr:NRDE family protein [Burkholderiales bacterium]
MCLILFAARAHAEYPLIVAANRDESYSRPAAPAGFWDDDPRVCAGRDLQHGGTWLGLSKEGRFAAITNYRQRPRSARGEHSRGKLTRDFLTGAQLPARYVRDVEHRAAAYTGFSLIVGDLNELWFYSNRGNGPQRITDGVHGLSNHLLDEPWPKVRGGIAALQSLLHAGEAELTQTLFRVLADRAPAPDHLLPSTGLELERERAVSAAFIPGATYGTRASTVVLVGADGRVVFLERRFGPEGASLGDTELRFELGLTPPVQAQA